MKVRFILDSCVNINSANTSRWFDPVKDLHLEEGEWQTLNEDEKWAYADEWAQERLSIDYEEEA